MTGVAIQGRRIFVRVCFFDLAGYADGHSFCLDVKKSKALFLFV